jgi:16S rRNA (adenine1518-N6/adenine1519-N6)-dimethyltransferase
MVQKEVGERIVSRPGQKQYGSLSVWMQSFLSPKLLFTVSPNVFRPKPKVHSAVLGFVSPEVGLWPGCTPGRLSRVLHICFQQRRKQIGTILKKQWGEELASILAEQGLDKTSRPEQINPQIFQKMAVFLASTQITT